MKVTALGVHTVITGDTKFHDFYMKLSELGVYEKWVIEFVAQHQTIDQALAKLKFLRCLSKFYARIDGSLVWSKTSQGKTFWADIASK